MRTQQFDRHVDKIRSSAGWWHCELDFNGRIVNITIPVLSDWPIKPDENILADARTLFGQTPIIIHRKSLSHMGVIESAISAIAILSDKQRRGEVYMDLTSIDEMEMQIDFIDILHLWEFHVPLEDTEHWAEVRKLVDTWLKLDRFSIFKS